MNNKKMIALFAIAVTTAFIGCKKNENENLHVSTRQTSTLSSGDGEWDLLGYGLDATGDLARHSISDSPIIDIARFETDYPTRLNKYGATDGDSKIYIGYSALDYFKENSQDKSFNATANYAKIVSTDTQKFNFTGDLNISKFNQNKKTFSSKYSYATYEQIHILKSLFFTQDATLNLLNQYLTSDFVNNIATMSADSLVKRYGTHVMLNINIGGKLSFSYRGVVEKEINYTNRKQFTKIGLSFGLKKIFGINLVGNKTDTEISEITYETKDRDYSARYYGGTNGGNSISIDKDGNTTDNINFAGWSSSINASNAAIVGVERTAFLYDFIADPTKKAQVKAVIEQRILDSQPKELGEVPIYVYYNGPASDHYFTPDNQPTIGNGGFKNEGVVFYAFSSAKNGAVPIYVYYSAAGTDHYFTPNNQPTIGGGGYRNEGIAFYAYNSPGPDRVPIYVYNGINVQDHYFSPVNQASIGNGGYRNEGIAFYAVL